MSRRRPFLRSLVRFGFWEGQLRPCLGCSERAGTAVISQAEGPEEDDEDDEAPKKKKRKASPEEIIASLKEECDHFPGDITPLLGRSISIKLTEIDKTPQN